MFIIQVIFQSLEQGIQPIVRQSVFLEGKLHSFHETGANTVHSIFRYGVLNAVRVISEIEKYKRTNNLTTESYTWKQLITTKVWMLSRKAFLISPRDSLDWFISKFVLKIEKSNQNLHILIWFFFMNHEAVHKCDERSLNHIVLDLSASNSNHQFKLLVCSHNIVRLHQQRKTRNH